MIYTLVPLTNYLCKRHCFPSSEARDLHEVEVEWNLTFIIKTTTSVYYIKQVTNYAIPSSLGKIFVDIQEAFSPPISIVQSFLHVHSSHCSIPRPQILSISNAKIYLPGGGWFIICACCSWNLVPILSLPAMNFFTHRFTQPVSRWTRDLVVKSSTQESKQWVTRPENIWEVC